MALSARNGFIFGMARDLREYVSPSIEKETARSLRRIADKRAIAEALADMDSGVILAKSCDDEPGDTFGDFAFQNYMDDMSDYFDACRYHDYMEQDLADTLL